MVKKMVMYCSVVAGLLLLSSCGGGNSSVSTVSGVAAAGAPLSGTAYLKDSSSPAVELSVPIAADGSFSFDVTNLTPPFLLKAAGTSNGSSVTLYSASSSPGIANINPLSHLAVSMANGSDNLTDLYSSTDTARMRTVAAALPDAITALQRVFQPTLVWFEATTANFISDPFAANHTGLDLFLDMTSISTSNGVVKVTDRGLNRTSYTHLSDLDSGSFDLVATSIPRAGQVSVWPITATVEASGSFSFMAIRAGAANEHFIWSVEEAGGGTITPEGIYTAPSTPGTYHVKATSVSDPGRSNTAAVSVGGGLPIEIVESAPGVFDVTARGLSDVIGISVSVVYDTATITNPRVEFNSHLAGTITSASVTTSGTVRLAAISAGSFAATGKIATITFDQSRASVTKLRSMEVEVARSNFTAERYSVILVLPTMRPPQEVNGSSAQSVPASVPLPAQESL
ncbi:hypothetical protein [Geobacter sp. DSM 9736]|uniref:hypothetical protein n=1 Tax=Geobacter sp. DSM 9736 TaxID=1277350 RepID=UPI000B4FEDAB|nr:hypothetical protein [Geobacter sp. DSM 9736]SNB47240.1 hypothetical protein SAMN06269301_2718 [Geobacter sp. DSM 9736]